MTLPRVGRRPVAALRLVGVTVVGGALLLAGIAALVLPGPGILLCVVGLAVLATEYAWAQRGLHVARERSQKTATRSGQSLLSTAAAVACGLAVLSAGALELLVGVPLLTTMTSVLLVLGGGLLVGSAARARRRHVATR